MPSTPITSTSLGGEPAISFTGAHSENALASLVKKAFQKSSTEAIPEQSPILEITGMSGKRYRLFINCLMASLQDARYLEVGAWTGSTLCAAIHGNAVCAVVIDNWSEFGGWRKAFLKNVIRFQNPKAKVEVIESDFRQVDFARIGPFNVYLFDGPHSERDHFDGLQMALASMDSSFIFIVDDWNWPQVRSGTLNAIKDLDLSIEFSVSIRTTLDDGHPAHDGFQAKTTDWHNGYFVAVLSKPGLNKAAGSSDNHLSIMGNEATQTVVSDLRQLSIQSPESASVLVCISFHFSRTRLLYLLDTVRALAEFSVRRLDIVILTNSADPLEVATISELMNPLLRGGQSLEIKSCAQLAHPYDLTWRHKPLITARFLTEDSQYSHFVYLEDDIRFSFVNFCYFLEFRSKLASRGFLPSFVRTEFGVTGSKLYASDFIAPFEVDGCPSVIEGSYLFCGVDTPYCGLFVLDRQLAEEYVASPSFDLARSASITDWGVRERAAMGLCWENPPRKFRSRYVIPVDWTTGKVSPSSWVTHLAGNYAGDPGSLHGKVPVNQLTWEPGNDLPTAGALLRRQDPRISRRRFDYNRAFLVNSRLREAEEEVNNLKEASEKSGLSIGYPGWNLLYYAALCSLKDDQYNLVIETGTNQGFSAICLAQALRDSAYQGKVITVDASIENLQRAEENISRAGLRSLVEIHCMHSLTLLANDIILNQPVRFAFLDSSNECEHVLKEFDLLYPRLEDTAIVFFDSTGPQITMPEAHVHRAIQQIVQRYRGNLINFPNTSWHPPGEAIWQKAPFE